MSIIIGYPIKTLDEISNVNRFKIYRKNKKSYIYFYRLKNDACLFHDKYIKSIILFKKIIDDFEINKMQIINLEPLPRVLTVEDKLNLSLDDIIKYNCTEDIPCNGTDDSEPKPWLTKKELDEELEIYMSAH